MTTRGRSCARSVGLLMRSRWALVCRSRIPMPAAAQKWPERTVRVIVSNPAGVAMDLIARTFTEQLALRWGQPVVVENIPGVDGIPAAREFVTRRDDHTLLYSFPALIAINPFIHEKLPYDPAHDLTPIASTSDNFIAIAASAVLDVGSLQDLERYVRSNPGKLTWAATPGVPYYALATFKERARADMVQAPYRDFSQALADLGEGRIQVVAAGVSPLLGPAQAGKIKLLAFVNKQRASIAPDVPTAAEAGYSGLTFSAVTGFFGWRDMPAQIQNKIAADVQVIASHSEVRERLEKMGIVAKGSTPTEFVADIETLRNQAGEISRAQSLKR